MADDQDLQNDAALANRMNPLGGTRSGRGSFGAVMDAKPIRELNAELTKTERLLGGITNQLSRAGGAGSKFVGGIKGFFGKGVEGATGGNVMTNYSHAQQSANSARTMGRPTSPQDSFYDANVTGHPGGTLTDMAHGGGGGGRGGLGGFLGRFGGGDPYLGSVVFQQAGQASSSIGALIGGRGQRTMNNGVPMNLAAASLGFNTQAGTFSPQYGRQQMMAGLAARNPLSGALGGEDIAQGTALLRSRFGPTLAGGDSPLMRGTQGVAGLLPGIGVAGAAGVMAHLASPGVMAATLPHDAGLIARGGRVRSPDEALRKLAETAIGGKLNQMSPEAVELKLFRGRGRDNLMMLVGGDQTTADAVVQYALASATHGRNTGGGTLDMARMSQSAAGMRQLKAAGIGTSYFQNTLELEQERSRTDYGNLEATRGLREAENDLLRSINRGLQGFATALAPAQLALEKVGSSASMVSDVLLSAFALQQLNAGKLLGSGGLGRGTIGGAGRAGTALRAGGRLLRGGALLAGGQVAGSLISGIGEKDGKQNWVAKDVGTIAKYAGAGAAIGSMFGGPVGTGIGAALGTAAGAVHAVIGNHILGGGQEQDVGDPVGTIKNSHNLNPTFLQRLQAMFAENPRLSITSGWRSYERQAQLYAEYKSGRRKAPAAPPGRSKHEKGLAADLGPRSEYPWIKANAARFGLHLPMPGIEPWHVEPKGVTAGVTPSGGTSSSTGSTGKGGGASISGPSAAPRGLVGAALLDSIRARPGTVSNFGGGVGSDSEGLGTAPPTGTGVRLTGPQIKQFALAAGFPPDVARIMAAIALGESSGNTRAHNPNAKTGDNSYGLWQINMLGNMGPARRASFGIKSNEELFDPMTNARAAKKIYDSQGYRAWSVYKKDAHKQYLDDVGDPISTGSGNSSVMVTGGGGTTIQKLDLHLNIKTDRITDSEARRLAEMTMAEIDKLARLTQVSS